MFLFINKKKKTQKHGYIQPCGRVVRHDHAVNAQRYLGRMRAQLFGSIELYEPIIRCYIFDTYTWLISYVPSFFRALDSSDIQIFFTHVHLRSMYVTTYVTDICDEKSVYSIIPMKCKNTYRVSHLIEVMMDYVI